LGEKEAAGLERKPAASTTISCTSEHWVLPWCNRCCDGFAPHRTL